VLCTVVKFAGRTQTHDLHVAFKLSNLMLEKDREDRLDRTFQKWRSIIKSEGEMNVLHVMKFGPGSSVGIATELRAGRSGIESRWGRDFPPVQTGPGAHSASCTMGTGSFPGVKCGRGVLLTTHPF